MLCLAGSSGWWLFLAESPVFKRMAVCEKRELLGPTERLFTASLSFAELGPSALGWQGNAALWEDAGVS